MESGRLIIYLLSRIGEHFSHGFEFSAFIFTLKSATIIQYTIKGRFMSR